MELSRADRLPRVTVGMPVYNGAPLLSRAIESILNQSFRDFEIVISNNASNDDTGNIIERYAKGDGRIRVYCQPNTIAPFQNFRFVLEHANGEFFFWAPHDDWWHPSFVASAVKALDSCPQAAAVMGTVHYVGKDGEVFRIHRPPYRLDESDAFRRIRSYLKQNVTDNLCYSVFRRAALDKVTWSVSLCPEKIIIMHVIGKGPIVDGWGMEYSNHYSFKTPEQIQEFFQMPVGKLSFQAQVFRDLLNEMQGAVGHGEFIALAWLLFFRQRWYRFIGKLLLHKLGLLKMVTRQ